MESKETFIILKYHLIKYFLMIKIKLIIINTRITFGTK